MQPLVLTASELDDHEWCPRFHHWRHTVKRRLIAPEPDWSVHGNWAHTHLERMLQGHPPELAPPTPDAAGQALVLALQEWWREFGVRHPWDQVLRTETSLEVDIGKLLVYPCRHVGSTAIRTGIQTQGAEAVRRPRPLQVREAERTPQEDVQELHVEGERVDPTDAGGDEGAHVRETGKDLRMLRGDKPALPDSGPHPLRRQRRWAESPQTGREGGLAEGPLSSPLHELQLGTPVRSAEEMPACPFCGTRPSTKRVILKGIPDACVVWNHELYHCSHKTLGATRPVQALVTELAHDLHENLYPLLIQQEFPGLPWGGTMANIIRKLSLKRMNELPRSALHIEFIPITSEGIESARQDALRIAQAIEDAAPHHRRKACTGVYRNSECSYHGPCWDGIDIMNDILYESFDPMERYKNRGTDEDR